MIIDSEHIIKKTDLRQNLASVMSRVIKGDKIFVSHRGNVVAVISSLNVPIEPSEHSQKVIAQQKELRKLFSQSRLASTDTTEFIRNQRNRRV